MVEASFITQLMAEADADGVQQLVVGAVVSSGDKVLLLQRPADDFMGGIFELPSGKVEAGEALDAALIREVKEEAGLDVSRIADYLGFFDYTSGTARRAGSSTSPST